MCLNGTYPFCQQPLSGNCHIICFVKPVLWTATRGVFFFCSEEGRVKREEKWYAAKGGMMGKRRGEGGPM